MKDRETRLIKSGKVELRQSADGKLKTLVGYAAVFNSMSEDMGFREIIAPGAFKRALKEGQDVRALTNHDSQYILGRTKSGTLRMKEDDHGLLIECDPPDTTYGRDLMESVARGDIDQMSFSFRCITDKWEMRDGVALRTLVDVDLYDVSPVTFPAYPATEIGLRSFEKFKKTLDLVSPLKMKEIELNLEKLK